MTNEQRDPAQMTEAEQMQANYERQQEEAKKSPVPHRPDAGTEQGFTNATAEQKAWNEEHGVSDPTVPATVTGTAGGTAKPRAPKR